MSEKINFHPTPDDWLTNTPKRYARLAVAPMTGKFLNFCDEGRGVRFTLDGRKKGGSFWVVVPIDLVTFDDDGG